VSGTSFSGAKLGAGAGAAFGAAALGEPDFGAAGAAAEADGIVRTWPALSRALSGRPLALASAAMLTFSFFATLEERLALDDGALAAGADGAVRDELGRGRGRQTVSEGTAAGAGTAASRRDLTGAAGEGGGVAGLLEAAGAAAAVDADEDGDDAEVHEHDGGDGDDGTHGGVVFLAGWVGCEKDQERWARAVAARSKTRPRSA
jgi:hypothetical protein